MKQLREIIAGNAKKYSASAVLKNTNGPSVTYEQLNENVNYFAKLISASFAKPFGNTIAIFSERHLQLPVWVYSILCSNNAYLPVDHRFPKERVSDILQEAKPQGIIIQNKYLAAFESEYTHTIHNKIYLDDDFTLVVLKSGEYLFPEHTAYILYTSGSTGKPKGVIHTAESMWAFLQWCRETLNVPDNGNYIWVSPLQFDLSVFDIFFPLLSGGSLLVLQENEVANQRVLAAIIAEQAIQYIYATPSFFKLMTETAKMQQYDYKSVRCTLLAGEQLHWELLHRIKDYFADSDFYNFYGPTETNVCVYYKVDFNDEHANPIAVPIGLSCRPAIIHLHPLPEAGEYELWVGGETLMYGYAGANTAKFEVRNGVKYYNTGDVVIKGTKGVLTYKGRTDRMIKKNGYRIEPAEVENCLSMLDGIVNVIVLPVSVNNQLKIVTFIQSNVYYTITHIKQYCLGKLPFYMVPDDVVYMENLPLNFNYKADTLKLTEEYVRKNIS